MKRVVAFAIVAAALAACASPDSSARLTPSQVLAFPALHPGSMKLTGAYIIPSFGCIEVTSLVKGPDKKIWFAEFEGDAIGAVTTDGTFDIYPTGTNTQPYAIAARRKSVWAGGYAGVMFASTPKGMLSSFPIAGAHVGDIVEGPDKNLWFTDYGNGKIGRITKSGAVTEFALNPGGSPGGIAVGADKNFWITEKRSFVKMSVSGAILKVYGSRKLTKGELLNYIVAAPDGKLYFSESANDNKTPDKIGRITTSGTVSEIGTLPVGAYPKRLAVGKDGNVYFAIGDMQAVGTIDLATRKVSYRWLPMTHDIGTNAIAEGADGRLWLGGCSTIYAVSY